MDIDPLQMVIINESIDKMKNAIRYLPIKEQTAVRMRFALNPYERKHTLKEISEKIGLTTIEGSRRVLLRALARIKRNLYSNSKAFS